MISGEHGDEVEMGRLLQLILGCAVNCDNKHVYIEKIMIMEEEVQHSVMNAIQDVSVTLFQLQPCTRAIELHPSLYKHS